MRDFWRFSPIVVTVKLSRWGLWIWRWRCRSSTWWGAFYTECRKIVLYLETTLSRILCTKNWCTSLSSCSWVYSQEKTTPKRKLGLEVSKKLQCVSAVSHQRIMIMLGFRSKLFIFCILISRIGGESLRDKIPCIENDKFYRNPNRDPAAVWSQTECANYYFCVEGEVFEFTCSTGLTFDINRQICDFKPNVGNCDVTAEETTPKPMFNTKEPICPTGELACADGTCIPTSLFCDGHPGNYFLFRKEKTFQPWTKTFPEAAEE